MEDGGFNTGHPLVRSILIGLWNGTDEAVLILYVMCKQVHIKHHLEQISSEKTFPFLPAMGRISVSSLCEIAFGSPIKTKIDLKPEFPQFFHWRHRTHFLFLHVWYYNQALFGIRKKSPWKKQEQTTWNTADCKVGSQFWNHHGGEKELCQWKLVDIKVDVQTADISIKNHPLV